MYVKFAWRNLERSIKDYLIYILTLVLAVGLFYSFLSVTSPYYAAQLPISINLSYLSQQMGKLIPGSTIFLSFLIVYVNSYIVRRREKEFGLEMIIGIDRRKVSFIFFIENFCIGIVAVFAGLLLGIFGTQIIKGIVLKSFDEPFRLVWSIYPDTIGWTMLFFWVLFLLTGIMNIKTLNKKSIKGLLYSAELGDLQKYDRSVHIIVLADCIMTIILEVMLCHGILPVFKKVSSNIQQSIGLWIVLMLILIIFSLKLLYKYYANKEGGIIEVIFTILSFCNSGLSFGCGEIMEGGVKEGALPEYWIVLPYLYGGVLLIVAVIFLYTSLSWVFLNKIEYAKLFKYHNLFFIGQIRSSIKRISRTLGVITVVMIMGLVILGWMPVLSGEAEGYLKERSIYDLQIFTARYGTEPGEKQENIRLDYKYIENYLMKEQIKVKDKAEINSYYINETDELKKKPILAIAVSDYNKLLCMSGETPIVLPDDSFALQWEKKVIQNDMDAFDKEYPILQVGEIKLNKLYNGNFQVSVGMGLFTGNVKAVFILPDYVCKELKIATNYYVANLATPISVEKAVKIDEDISLWLNYLSGQYQGDGYIRIKTLQLMQGISYTLMQRLGSTYISLVLIIVCASILALQQIMDVSEHKKRFSIIKKIGIGEKETGYIIRKQVGIWFIISTGIASVISIIVLIFICIKNYRNYINYIPITSIVGQTGLVYCKVTASCYIICSNIFNAVLGVYHVVQFWNKYPSNIYFLDFGAVASKLISNNIFILSSGTLPSKATVIQFSLFI